MNRTINVVVVDDSAVMRKSLSMMLESDPAIRVVATGRNGKEGIEKIRQCKPDLVTMDIEMPEMDGLTALGIIMKDMPLPVLMVSSLTTEGARATLEALHLGAVDFIPKDSQHPGTDIARIREDLVTKVKQIVLSRSLQFRLRRIREGSTARCAGTVAGTTNARQVAVGRRDLRAVVAGISTGGPFALLQVIPKLPKDFPLGIAIVQHMPPKFTRSMAERLAGMSALRVKEAETGDLLEPGSVLIAPGGMHMTFVPHGKTAAVMITPEPADTLYRPSADVMMRSATEAFRAPLLGLIMTGMGRDGLEGLKQIKHAGGYVLAQNEETCVVYGMPRAAVEEGLADAVLPLEEIPRALVRLVSE